MKQYRSAQGKMVDMTALMAKNERVRAVGNMKVNARGDTIDSQGKVITPVTQKVGAAYQATVGNKTAQVKKEKPNTKVELTKEEIELESFNDLDKEIEEIKSKEKKK
jgi:hypothetical protein